MLGLPVFSPISSKCAVLCIFLAVAALKVNKSILVQFSVPVVDENPSGTDVPRLK